MALIQLVKAPSHGDTVIRDQWYLPLELLWVGTYLRRFGHEVEVLDGQLLSSGEITDRLAAPIVGFGFNIFSTRSLDTLVAAAKQKGAFVVVGGHAATALAPQLLRGNKGIDAVVRYDGEEAVRQMADALDAGRDPFIDTPNVVYRRNGKIVSNPVREVPVHQVPIPDRCLDGIDMEQYIRNFKRTNTFLAFCGERATNAHTKKGCPRRCSFCGRSDRTHRARTPVQAFEEYRYLVDDFGVDYIFDHSDTWAVDLAWLEGFRDVYEREGGLPAKLAVFADLRDISEQTVEILGAVGVNTVETGIESANERILRASGKFVPRDEIVQRIRALADAGIKVEASLILGMPDETRQSVQETLSLSRELRQRPGSVRSYTNILLPLPGSGIWQTMMRDPALRTRYGSDYAYDTVQLRKDYLSRYCDLGDDAYEYLVEERNALLAENGLAVMDYER